MYFTDGIGEDKLTVKPMCKEVLWVIVGEEELSLKEPFGKIRRIKSSKKVSEGKTAAIEELNGVIYDWAR